MKNIKSGALALLFAMAMLFSLLSASGANAASIYDNIVKPVKHLTLIDPDNPLRCSVDLSDDWEARAASLSPWAPSLFAAKTSWVVSDEFNSSGYPINVQIAWWTNGLTQPSSFTSDRLTFVTSPLFAIRMYLDPSDCTLRAAVVNPVFVGPARFAQGDTYRPYLSHNISVTYPSGYEGVQVPGNTVLSIPSYTALGDSFSSGEGVPTYFSSTDVDGVNECHVSETSYPYEVAPIKDLGVVKNATCSGATISDVEDGTVVNMGQGSWGNPRQISHIDSGDENVTISVGGNDIGFGTVLATCMKQHAQTGSNPVLQDTYDTQVCLNTIDQYADDLENGSLDVQLQTLYSDILDRMNSSGQLYVMGYPNIFAGPTDVSNGCTWANFPVAYALGGYSNRDVTVEESVAMQQFHDRLIDKISTAVSTMNDDVSYQGRIHFVNVTPYFAGHELCTSDEYLHHVYLADPSDADVSSFHPNQKGQDAYARALIDAMH